MSSASDPPVSPEVTAAEADRLAAGSHRILDVREPAEFAAGHVAGAVHIPLADLPLRHPELEGSVAWLAICRSGFRSMQATVYLRAQGLDVVNVAGGMHAWQAAGLPMQDLDGGPGRVV